MTRHLVHHVEHGSGVPVLALHGWSPDHRLMTGCLEPVFSTRHGYRRLYPDLPGMGATPAGPEITSSDDVLAAVTHFIDTAIGNEPFLLIGESYGGYLARAVVRERPDQVLGLALICPLATPYPDRRTMPTLRILRSDPGLFDGLDPEVAEGFAGLAVVQTRQTLHRYREEIKPGLDAADTAALARIQQRWALRQDPDDPGLAPFEAPTLILLGRQDNLVGYADQIRLLPAYPRASLAVLDTAGHNLQLEQPDLFNALMFEWLDRVATPC